jgi:hypothetical protein
MEYWPLTAHLKGRDSYIYFLVEHAGASILN